MATAALISPSTPYHPHHPPSFSGFHHGPSSTVPGMISPAESRRTSDGHETPHRQSLPSIQEVIGQKPPSFPPPQSTAMSAAQSLPSPFSTSTPTRPFADSSEKHPSPRTLHPTTSFPRTETLPAFSDPARSSFSARPPPLSTFTGPHPSPPVTMEQQRSEPPPPSQQHEQDPRQAEGQQQVNGGYHHPPHVPAQVPYHPPGHLPPGQLPLSAAYPISPRHGQPPLPSPFEQQRPMLHPDDSEYSRPRSVKYEATLSRHYEAWSYAEYLARIGATARTLFNFAEAYSNAAREEHAPQPIPTRLPTEREIADMIHNADWLRTMLDNVRNVVQQTIIDERAREGSRSKGPYDNEDVPMYNDGMKPAYGNPAAGVGEVKKRRGRAAPPGRCHSCNRMDTPEWRRGPDGARTLCNACGLHYAKLERKKASETRSLRPKPAEEQQQQQQQQHQQQQPPQQHPTQPQQPNSQPQSAQAPPGQAQPGQMQGQPQPMQQSQP